MNKRILLAAAACLLLLFFHYIGILSPFERAFVWCLKPVMRLVYSMSDKIGQGYTYFASKSNLEKQNNLLKEQLAGLLQEKSGCTEISQENDFLRQQMNFVRQKNWQQIIASVIGKSNESVLILDVGENDGIVLGLPVLQSNGILVAKITKVEKNRSFALLLNDDNSQVLAKLQNFSKTMGSVQGQYNLGLQMKLIPQTEDVQTGQIVVTSGLEEKIPSGLVIGQITSVKKEPEQLFQEAGINSLADFNKITKVMIIKEQNGD